MTEIDGKSALSFYRIQDPSIFEMSILDVWADFVVAKVDGVSCSNVFHFELSAEELLEYVKNIDNSNELFSDIRSEYELGAHIMFVSPLKGGPLDGFLLKKLLSN
jgi:hypothetical protein